MKMNSGLLGPVYGRISNFVGRRHNPANILQRFHVQPFVYSQAQIDHHNLMAELYNLADLFYPDVLSLSLRSPVKHMSTNQYFIHKLKPYTVLNNYLPFLPLSNGNSEVPVQNGRVMDFNGSRLRIRWDSMGNYPGLLSDLVYMVVYIPALEYIGVSVPTTRGSYSNALYSFYWDTVTPIYVYMITKRVSGDITIFSESSYQPGTIVVY